MARWYLWLGLLVSVGIVAGSLAGFQLVLVERHPVYREISPMECTITEDPCFLVNFLPVPTSAGTCYPKQWPANKPFKVINYAFNCADFPIQVEVWAVIEFIEISYRSPGQSLILAPKQQVELIHQLPGAQPGKYWLSACFKYLFEGKEVTTCAPRGGVEIVG